MSLYTPVFPPSFERKSTGRKGASSSNKLNQLSTTEILRDIHLFLATKPEVLVPSSRPSSPSFDEHVKTLKHTVLEAVDAARGDAGDRKWTQISAKLKMGCVRGRYRMTGINQRWHPVENPEWILPDDEETWLKLEHERAEARTSKGNAKQSRHPDNMSIAAVAPSRGSDLAANQPPVETIQALATVPHKTMRSIKEKVAKWQATISTPEDALVTEKTASTTPALRGASRSGMKPKDKSQSSSLSFPVVKRGVATVTGKKSNKGRSDRHTPSNSRVHGDPKGGDTASGSNLPVAPSGDEPEKASFKTPLRSLHTPDGDFPKITDFPETPYIPPSFPSQLETSTPKPRHDVAVPARTKPPPIYPVCLSSSIPHPSTPRDGDHNHLGEDPPVDISPSLPLHSDGRRTSKRPLSPSSLHDIVLSTSKKQRLSSSPGEYPASCSRPPTQSANIQEVMSKPVVMPVSPSGEGRLPTLTELLAATPRPKTRQKPPLQNVLRAESEPSPHSAKKNPSPVRSYFSTPGSGQSDSPTSNHNLLLHSPVSPMRSFAQNPNAFLPQFTSTQAGGSCHNGMSSGVFGGGYRSQFDVERHVDRVSELLEKDVDFGGWLRDVPSLEELEASQEQ